ncbi:SDR family NAD(P)-dependent oxidoreductase [Paenibacillus mendelii]|uniref:SDR family NAD(P)-dependent oxidoreductase n=1 Tax=Paenibacillus mendelii TaxID=206163 RepID=A0ABV6JAK5_9BACL|nr:3-oxoacyl-ACP reductase family protein [Paenibacillus mendelii]MCQ6560689.1 3-oxoacyl-ACP reductase FabG [Paenibacillus mendelii]
MRLKGKRALVTGGSRGIGRAIVEALAAEGADVAINYYKEKESALEVVRAVEAFGGKGVAVQGDVGSYDSIDQLVKGTVDALGGIDILVNNAGICWFMPFLELTKEAWERTIGVDLTGTFYCSQQVAKQMVSQGNGGRIINVTSIGSFQSNATQTHYCAAKGGQDLLAKGMAIELAEYGITVNNIAPGTILTDINTDFFNEPGNLDRYHEKIPMKRLGKPQDCGGAAVFFASDEASYVTGATILVDGGHLAQL